MMTGSVTQNCVEMAHHGHHCGLAHHRRMPDVQLNKLEGPLEGFLPSVIAIEPQLERPLFEPCAFEQNDPAREGLMLALDGATIQGMPEVLILSGQPMTHFVGEQLLKFPLRGSEHLM